MERRPLAELQQRCSLGLLALSTQCPLVSPGRYVPLELSGPADSSRVGGISPPQSPTHLRGCVNLTASKTAAFRAQCMS